MKELDGDREPVASDEAGSSEADVAASVPAALLAEWRAAEERLYPMVMVIPEAYERVVRLVGEVTVELQLACSDPASLVAAAPAVADRVRRLAEESGYAATLDFPLIAAAACLVRYRQMEAEIGRDLRRRRIRTALEAGATWVTLVEGRPPTMWPPLPSATLEMHVASGRALEQTTTIDETTGAPRFGLSEIDLDPRTGELATGEAARAGDVGGEEGFDDLHEWRSAIARRRQMIEENH